MPGSHTCLSPWLLPMCPESQGLYQSSERVPHHEVGFNWGLGAVLRAQIQLWALNWVLAQRNEFPFPTTHFLVGEFWQLLVARQW